MVRRPRGSALWFAISLAIALGPSCHGTGRGAPGYGVAPVRTVPGYPLRFRVLGAAERTARARDVMAKSPGWTVTLDELGLLNFASRTGVSAGPITGADRAALSAFMAANLSILGLERMPDLSAARPQGGALVLTQQGGRYQISLTRGGLEGHFLPGWRAWPAPLTDDQLLARFVGLPATARERECSLSEGMPCDPVGPGDCAGPSWGPEKSIHVTRADVFVAQRYWYFRRFPARGEVELRFIAEARPYAGSCGGPVATSAEPDPTAGPRRIRQVELTMPDYLDGMTGQPLFGSLTDAR